jgi:uncharacterized Ntn-hydrolase superfamily protein
VTTAPAATARAAHDHGLRIHHPMARTFADSRAALPAATAIVKWGSASASANAFALSNRSAGSVGNGVLWAEADVGVVATQAIVDVSYGPQGLALLRQGLAPDEVVRRILDNDPDPRPDDWPKEGRQFSLMDAHGRVATYTGPKASEWAGHRIAPYVSAQGNILAGPQVVDSMVAGRARSDGPAVIERRAWLRDRRSTETRAVT